MVHVVRKRIVRFLSIPKNFYLIDWFRSKGKLKLIFEKGD